VSGAFPLAWHGKECVGSGATVRRFESSGNFRPNRPPASRRFFGGRFAGCWSFQWLWR